MPSSPAVPVRRILEPPGPFWTFNREERNAVAVLFALLTHGDNLRTFVQVMGWEPRNVSEIEISVEWTFLRDLWSFHSGKNNHSKLRLAILDSLQPSNRATLEILSIPEFNRCFVGRRNPSAHEIESPSNWSVERLSERIPDDDELLRTCMYKWAFNVKPDLVLQSSDGQVLVVEAKWFSAEGKYPSSSTEKTIFNARGLPRVSQIEVQRYLVEELLGFEGTYRFLTRSATSTADYATTVTWADLLEQLDLSHAPAQIEAWCSEVIHRSTSR